MLVALFVIAAFPQAKPEFTPPPTGAVVLFDGKNASAWTHRGSGGECQWRIVDGTLEVTPGKPDIVTKNHFGDYRLHVEFWLPLLSDKKDQGKANSGVYNHGRYEIQILDSFQNPTYKFGGCGAIYGLKDPDSNAILPPEQWNSYDIDFRAPRIDRIGKVIELPRITVRHNGVVIHRDVEIPGKATTAGLEGNAVTRGPILLQNHGNPVRFRNIWILPK